MEVFSQLMYFPNHPSFQMTLACVQLAKTNEHNFLCRFRDLRPRSLPAHHCLSLFKSGQPNYHFLHEDFLVFLGQEDSCLESRLSFFVSTVFEALKLSVYEGFFGVPFYSLSENRTLFTFLLYEHNMSSIHIH